MSKNLRQLEQLLEVEIENYCHLKDLESQKTEVLVNGGTEDLVNVIKDQEILANSLRTLETRRKELQQACAEEKGMDKMSTLGDLVKQTSNEIGENLINLRQQLLNLVKEISRLTHNNEVLLKQNITHVKELFNIVAGKSKKLSYGSKGENAQLDHRIIMDQSA